MSNETFIKASQEALRFNTTQGFLSVEDLWTLTLVSLDKMAIAIDASLTKATSSFLENPNQVTEGEYAQILRLDVLKIVIDVKQTENKEKLAISKRESQRSFLKELLNKKKIEELEGLDVEEIEKQLAEI